MRPFKAASLPSLSRRPLPYRSVQSHAIRRRPRSRQLSSARTLRNDQQDQPSKVMVYSLQNAYPGKRFFTWVFYFATSMAFFRFVGNKLSEVDEAAGELDDEHISALQEEGDDEPLFIALQYPKKLPQQFYKASDPDWKEFANVSRNKERKEAIQKELAERVSRDVSKHPQMAMALGKNIKVNRYWLDFKYPDAPPPQYARTGIEISDDYLALSTQVMPHSYYIELSHMLWPRAVFGAALTSLNLFGRIQLINLKNLLGMELNHGDQQIQLVTLLERNAQDVEKISEKLKSQRGKTNDLRAALEQQLKEAEARRTGASRKPPPSTTKPPALPASTTPSATSTSDDPSPLSNSPGLWTMLKRTRPPPNDSSGSSYWISWLPSPPIPTPEHVLKPLTSSTNLKLAWKSFASVLSHNWQQSKLDQMPKGAFFVVGEVEVSGDRARCKADVRAAYDPKTAKFAFVIAQVKTVWEHRQSAKGGP